ncbi:MAG: DNA polymerase III subunit delta [Oscillospiraceae bacterium]|nr:DNA polymerase III subunit delta [Oscillospiraceae bacterium]
MGKNNVYIVYGTDGYLKKHFVSNLLRQVGVAHACNLTILSDDFEFGEMMSIAQTVPFAEDKRCVIVKDFFDVPLESKAKGLFIDFLCNVASQTILIFLQTASKQIAATTKLFASVGDIATIKEFNAMPTTELLDFVAARICENDKKVEKAALRLLVSRCASNLHTILLEVDKLCSFANALKKTTIEIADIELLVAGNIEQSAFEISKMLTAGELSRAQHLFAQLAKKQEQLSLLVAAIATLFMDMLRAKIADVNRIPPAVLAIDLASVFNGKSFRVQAAYNLARKYSSDAIVRCIHLLSDLDVALKTTRADQVSLAQEALCGIYLTLKKE